jgi:hypothetical protein
MFKISFIYIMKLKTAESEENHRHSSSHNVVNSTIQGITGLKYNPYKSPANLKEAMDHRVN